MGIEPEVNDTLEDEQLLHGFEVFGYKLKQKLEYNPDLLDFSFCYFDKRYHDPEFSI